MNCRNTLGLHNYKYCLALLLALLLSAQSASATTVRVITSLGEFSIELFDDIPIKPALALALEFRRSIDIGVHHRV